jgi:hypothetical protein
LQKSLWRKQKAPERNLEAEGDGYLCAFIAREAKDRLRAMDHPSVESLVIEEPFKEGFDKDTE